MTNQDLNHIHSLHQGYKASKWFANDTQMQATMQQINWVVIDHNEINGTEITTEEAITLAYEQHNSS